MKKLRAMRALCVTVTVLAILAGLFTGCTESGTNTKKADVRIAANSDLIKFFDANGLTASLGDKAGVRIHWMDYGTADEVYARVQADLSVGARTRPDAYLGLGLYEDQIALLGPDLFLDLSGVIDEGTVELRNILEADPAIRDALTQGGKLYSFPSFYEDYANEFPQKAWINKDWLQEVGAELPSTTEELYDVLLKFREKYGSAADAPSEEAPSETEQPPQKYPLGIAYKDSSFTTFGFIISAFVQTDYDLSDAEGYINLDDTGKVTTAVTSDGYKEALKYIRRLFDDRLVRRDVFGLGAETFLTGKPGGETYGVIAAPDINALFNNAARASVYIPLPPLNGETGSTVFRPSRVEAGGFMITKNSDKIEHLLKLGDAMLSKSGTLTILYGKEGIGWNEADDRIAPLGGTTTSWKRLFGSLETARPYMNLKGRIPFWYPASLAMQEQATPEQDGSVNLQTDQNWHGYLNQITKEHYEQAGRKYQNNRLPEVALSSSGTQAAELHTYLTATSRSFVLSELDIDEGFETYKTTLREKGLEAFLEDLQQALAK